MNNTTLLTICAGFVIALSLYAFGFIAGYESAKKQPKPTLRRKSNLSPKFKISKSQLN